MNRLVRSVTVSVKLVEVNKMSLPIVLSNIITIMGIFAFSIILLARKNNVSLKQTVDSKPINAYKNGEQKKL